MFTDVPVDYSADTVMSFCVQLFRHEFFTSRKEVTGTFLFFPTKPTFVRLAQSRHFLKGMSVVSLLLGIADASFSITTPRVYAFLTVTSQKNY